MAVVYPEAGRVKVKELPESLTFHIPVRKNAFILMFLGLWLCGWAMGEITALGALLGKGWMGEAAPKGTGFEEGRAFLAVWLLFWTAGGFFALSFLLYQLKGREEVTLDGQYLRHVRDFLVWKRSREYLREHVKDIRLSRGIGSLADIMSPARGLEFWGIGGGTLCFDYGSRTIRFGAGLEEAEAKPLIDLLRRRAGEVRSAGAFPPR